MAIDRVVVVDRGAVTFAIRLDPNCVGILIFAHLPGIAAVGRVDRGFPHAGSPPLGSVCLSVAGGPGVVK
jgi:hypothetical protein